MQQRTESTPAQDSPAVFGYCAWHRGHAEGVRLIEAVEQGSGPGGNLFACPPCRDVHGLVPFADR